MLLVYARPRFAISDARDIVSTIGLLGESTAEALRKAIGDLTLRCGRVG
ncbi:hypothetical protein AB0O65_00440 [Microbacterium sp. NPDC077391]